MAKQSPIQNRDYILFGLRLIGEFGAIIALPIVLFVMAGQWADDRFGTKLFFTGAAFVVSAAISGRIIVKKAKVYGKMYQAMINREIEEKENQSSKQ